MKRIRVTSILIHAYMFITVVATIFLFQIGDGFLFDLSAGSWLIGIVGGSAEASNGFVYILLLLWSISLPVLLIVSYIMACKKIYIPFAVITAIDSLVVLFWTINRFAAKDMYTFDAWFADAIVSTLFTALLVTFLCIERRRKEPATMEDESKIADYSLALELPTKPERTAELLQHSNSHF